MPLHYYDPEGEEWRTIANPTHEQIAEMLINVSRARPCEWCDADVEYGWRDGGGPPDIEVTHEPGCPDAA